MLMTSGANIGFLRTFPHMLGIIFGFSFMVVSGRSWFDGCIFICILVLHQMLNIVCIAYLFYLAWKIARSQPSDNETIYQPMSFFQPLTFNG